MTDNLSMARALTLTLLSGEALRTPEVIRKHVSAVSLIMPQLTSEDVETLISQLMHEANVHVPDATFMSDPADHIEWLSSRRSEIEWNFWRRYKVFLAQKKGFAEPVVGALETLTDEILSRLEDPERRAPWDCRGMVVGSVQSGKTANYCGLICKAIDSGYRLIVVLAGMHDNLRSQTQYRIDEGILGRDSQKERQLDQANSLIGVGTLVGQSLPIHTLTSSLDDGDFRAPKADTGVSIGGDPVILVVKKNSSVLRNLLKWVLHVRGEDVGGGKRKLVRGVPMLLIDDEADNASINTRDRKKRTGPVDEVTAINGRIRELLDSFEKSAYVGYTATPFANIFINPEAETPSHGEDLFPRSFILNVSPPSNYVSPSRVFGIDGDADSGFAPIQPLPLVTTIKDHGVDFPPKHKKDLVVAKTPESLRKAILCFVLVCAARRARGQIRVHNSMLVHVTRFVAVQHQVAQLVQEQIQSIRMRLELGEGDRQKTLLTELAEIWKADFEPVSAAVKERMQDEDVALLTWKQVADELREAALRIEVREINGHATDALDYVSHRDGFSVIAVGGDKLSRGLTLEGLSVSYFLRASQMYDTLMQMGRWFGYRPGYLDLCRLFTTDDLCKWYRHIALAEIELRREFERMKSAGLTPQRYGLRVREHPQGLLVTALNKMAHARTQKLSYASRLVQTPHFSTDSRTMRRNFDATASFLEGRGGVTRAHQEKAGWLWWDVSAAALLDSFLGEIDIVSENWQLQPAELMQFIHRQAQNGELISWTVALIDTDGKAGSIKVAGCDAGIAKRSPEENTWSGDQIPSVFSASNSNVQSPRHQYLDLQFAPTLKLDEQLLQELLAKRVVEGGALLFATDEQEMLRRAHDNHLSLGAVADQIARHREYPGGVSGEVARMLRPKTHGLILIYPILPADRNWDSDVPFMGIAISFPYSHTARAVDYRVNRIWQTKFEDEEYTDED